MYIADLHIHSKYSRATSRDCVPEQLDFWARRKGIDLLGTGDFTHPAWRKELEEKLIPAEEGLYRLRDELCQQPAGVAGEPRRPRFVLSGEISSIYKKNGKVRKVHNVILLPSLEAADTLAHKLEAIGNIHSDDGLSWGWTAGICWKLPWSPAQMLCSSPPISGPLISPCLAHFLDLTP